MFHNPCADPKAPALHGRATIFRRGNETTRAGASSTLDATWHWIRGINSPWGATRKLQHVFKGAGVGPWAADCTLLPSFVLRFCKRIFHGFKITLHIFLHIAIEIHDFASTVVNSRKAICCSISCEITWLDIHAAGNCCESSSMRVGSILSSNTWLQTWKRHFFLVPWQTKWYESTQLLEIWKMRHHEYLQSCPRRATIEFAPCLR